MLLDAGGCASKPLEGCSNHRILTLQSSAAVVESDSMMRVITWLLSITLAAAIPPAPAAAQAFPPPVGDSGRRTYTPADVHFMAGLIYHHPPAAVISGGAASFKKKKHYRTVCRSSHA